MKRNIFLFLAVSILLTALTPQTAQAANKTAGVSAVLYTAPIQPLPKIKEDKRAQILQAYLESYDSPLAPHAKTFIEEADRNNLDWKLLPAITGVESYFGQMIPPYSNNGWGYGVYGNNVIRFATWDEGIMTVTKALRVNYIERGGATNIHEIGSIYAADPQWPYKVQRFINEIDAYTLPAQKPTLSLSL